MTVTNHQTLERNARRLIDQGYSEHDAWVIVRWEDRKQEAMLDRRIDEVTAQWERKANRDLGLSFDNQRCKHIWADWCHNPNEEGQEKCPFYHDQTKCPDFER